MVSATFGIVFHADPAEIPMILKTLEETCGIKILCVKQSWGKIWLKEGDAP